MRTSWRALKRSQLKVKITLVGDLPSKQSRLENNKSLADELHSIIHNASTFVLISEDIEVMNQVICQKLREISDRINDIFPQVV